MPYFKAKLNAAIHNAELGAYHPCAVTGGNEAPGNQIYSLQHAGVWEVKCLGQTTFWPSLPQAPPILHTGSAET